MDNAKSSFRFVHSIPGIADAGMGEEGDSGVERLARGALGRHIRPERGGGAISRAT